MRADVMLHTSSILLDDLPCVAFHLYAALHCCGVIAAQICICKYMHIWIHVCMYVNIYRLAQFILDLHAHGCMHARARTCTRC